VKAGWVVPLVLSVGVFALKGAGPLLLGKRRLPVLVERVAAFAPAGLLAALVMVSAFKVDGARALAVDARAVGLLAAMIALSRKAGFIVVVFVAAAATTAARWFGMA
jgi:branched-subunit amino acid transport protein